MAARTRTKLSVYEWIRNRDEELRTLGLDPALRLAITGHRRPLCEPWLDSVGCWSTCETSELINERDPYRGRLRVTPSAFRKFKARHRLKTRRQFETCHGPYSWTLAEVCFSEHERAQRVFRSACGCDASIGVACEFALTAAGPRWRPTAIGVLPVEMVLWVRVFGAFLEHHGIDYGDWDVLGTDERRLLWLAGREGEAWSTDMFLHAHASPRLAEPSLPFAC